MKYVALLRGIMPMNPNMHSLKLKEFFEGLGFKNVHTVIASGNVVFESHINDAKKLEDLIEKELPKRLGFNSKTIVKSEDQLRKFVAKKPFGKLEDASTSRLNVTFLKNKTKTDLKFPYASDTGYTVLGIVDDAVLTVIDLSGASTPDVMIWLEKQFTKDITTRTLKTVMRILDKFEKS